MPFFHQSPWILNYNAIYKNPINSIKIETKYKTDFQKNRQTYPYGCLWSPLTWGSGGISKGFWGFGGGLGLSLALGMLCSIPGNVGSISSRLRLLPFLCFRCFFFFRLRFFFLSFLWNLGLSLIRFFFFLLRFFGESTSISFSLSFEGPDSQKNENWGFSNSTVRVLVSMSLVKMSLKNVENQFHDKENSLRIMN